MKAMLKIQELQDLTQPVQHKDMRLDLLIMESEWFNQSTEEELLIVLLEDQLLTTRALAMTAASLEILRCLDQVPTDKKFLMESRMLEIPDIELLEE